MRLKKWDEADACFAAGTLVHIKEGLVPIGKEAGKIKTGSAKPRLVEILDGLKAETGFVQDVLFL